MQLARRCALSPPTTALEYLFRRHVASVTFLRPAVGKHSAIRTENNERDAPAGRGAHPEGVSSVVDARRSGRLILGPASIVVGDRPAFSGERARRRKQLSSSTDEHTRVREERCASHLLSAVELGTRQPAPLKPAPLKPVPLKPAPLKPAPVQKLKPPRTGMTR